MRERDSALLEELRSVATTVVELSGPVMAKISYLNHPEVLLVVAPQQKHELTVRTTDLNYGGHLSNDRLLSPVHEARVSWLAKHGWSELDCAGVGLIMGDAVLFYQGEFFAGDLLVFEVEAAEKPRSGFRL